MPKVYLDFETRSEADLKEVGAWNYSKHPTTHILTAVFITEDDTVTKYFKPEVMELVEAINYYRCRGYTFVAHNATFEKSIIINVLGQTIDHENWMCTMAKACHATYPRSLDELGISLKLDIVKDPRGAKLIELLCKPRKPTKKDPSRWNNDQALLNELLEYCYRDVQVCKLIDETLPELSPRERSIYILDQKINFRGVPIDIPLVKESLEYREELRGPVERRITEISNGYITSPTQAVRLKDYINQLFADIGLNRSINGVTEEDLEPLINDPDTPQTIKELAELRLYGSLTSTAKYQKIYDQVDKQEARLYNLLKYHGASTGRWAGSGAQFHNLPRGDDKYKDQWLNSFLIFNRHYMAGVIEEPTKLLKSAIRGVMYTHSGNTFNVADYNAIEARVLAWLVNEETMLDSYANKKCLYTLMASRVYNVPQEQIDKKSKERFVGKELILACGYGMGYKKFVERVASFGHNIPEDQAKILVNDKYRKSFPKIPAFWSNVEQAAKAACMTHGVWHLCGKAAFYHDGRVMYCRLPSGRLLFYPFANLSETQTKFGNKLTINYLTVETKAGQSKSFIKNHTYGGKLTENICQAIARDILAEGMINVTEAGYNVILTIHDEIVSEDPINSSELNIDRFCRILETPPSWAPDIPLAVEGWCDTRYHK